MESNLYDEFGNYIGPEFDESEEEELEDEGYFADEREEGSNGMQYDGQLIEADSAMDIASGDNRIVLHEDKKYYPDAEEVFPGVRTVTLDEDAQELEEPIIKPIRTKNFSVLEKDQPKLRYSNDFMTTLMHSPALIRNVALLGHLHHGKTSLVDTLVQATQEREWDPTKNVRYTDSRKDEQEREISIKSTPVSLVLESLTGKSYLLNLIDCPGHVNFNDESTAALRISDGAVIVIDAVEGVMMNTERLIKHALENQARLCLVLNKVDRLILELKLPPTDAYYKLLNTLDDVNRLVRRHTAKGCEVQNISPEFGNVCFASSQHGWSFTLQSFAMRYAAKYNNKRSNGDGVDSDALAKRLWGDWFFDERHKTFSRSKPHADAGRTFVTFVLEPLYKLYSQVIGEDPEQLAGTLKRLGVVLKHREAHMDTKPLLRIVLSRYFGYPSGFVDMVVNHIPSPLSGGALKVHLNYTGMQTSEPAVAMQRCDADGPLMINIVKMYNTPDGSSFLSLGRVFSGAVKVGQMVKVLGEAYTEDDDEDMAVLEVKSLAVGMGRFSIEVNSAIAGNWILIEGVDSAIKKTATITSATSSLSGDEAAVFRPLQFESAAVVKLAVEPLKPSELPKMVEGLRRINKSYPLVTTRVEESGEHVIFGTGELALDCIMHDLRHLYSDIEAKVADPVVAFCETVMDSSSIKCYAETPNKRNKLTMLAEPLDEGLAEDIEKGAVRLSWERKNVAEFFQSKYEWDYLTSRSIWAFGPDECGPNVLLDDTLSQEVDKGLLNSIRESVIQGFKWSCREGPLCDEPIRNTKFKILSASIASEPIHRGGGQIIPTARRAAYSAFLMATPRLMEPIYLVEMQMPADCVGAINPVLARRRGHMVQDTPKPGAPFYTGKAYIPVMDSFGFETDLRSFTQGQAFCQQVFDHWAIVPGHPLDRNVVLHPLEPSPPPALARDFMVKTRRRKGLSEEVSISKYFDDPMLLELWKQETEQDNYF